MRAVLEHLSRLVAFDTRNPPRRIGGDGIFAYLRAALGPRFRFDLQDLGDGCVSLLATRGTPRVLYNFHVDTVPAATGWQTDPLELVVEGDRAVGLGACDIKGAAACMLAALESGSDDAALLFTSDEEAGSSACVRGFLATQPSFDAVVVAETTQARAVVAHRGIATSAGVFHGVEGHSSAARALRDSAVHEAVRWSSAALRLARDYENVEFRGLRGVRFNLGVLQGGQKPNMIAGEATVRWGVRPLPSQSLQDVVAEFQRCAPDPGRVTWGSGFAGSPLPVERAPALGLASGLGFNVGPEVDFWTEAALFSEAGLDALVFGPGDIAQAHAPGEWVSLSQLQAVRDAYAGAVLRSFSGGV